ITLARERLSLRRLDLVRQRRNPPQLVLRAWREERDTAQQADLGVAALPMEGHGLSLPALRRDWTNQNAIGKSPSTRSPFPRQNDAGDLRTRVSPGLGAGDERRFPAEAAGGGPGA